MGRRREAKVYRKKDGSSGTTTSLMLRLLMLLCVVSSMALVLQLNITNQHNLMLRNIQGAEEARAWAAQPADPTCRPRRHLVFLKTHKCGSSTLQSVFLRYASNNNLSVALPHSGVYLDAVGTGQSLRVKELKESPFAPPSGKYHMLVHHTRLNVRAIQQVTYNDSVWVTVLREPAAVFESMFHYYHLHKFFGATFDHLVWKLGANDGGDKIWPKNANSRYQGRLGKNQMSFDLGLDDLDTHMESVLKDAIGILDHTFHLVMIAERMDESLVLLKHLLCWEDEDVVAMAHNVRKDLYRSYLSEQTVATLERLNAADVKLYHHFKEKFDKQVEAFGRGRMEQEVVSLRARRDKVWKQCGLRESRSSTSTLRQPSGKDHHVIGYHMHRNVTSRLRKFCQDLIQSTPELTQMLRRKQYIRQHQRGARSSLNLSWSQAIKKRKFKRKPRAAAFLGRRVHRKDKHTSKTSKATHHKQQR